MMSLRRGSYILAGALLVVLTIGFSSIQFAAGEPSDPRSRTAQGTPVAPVTAIAPDAGGTFAQGDPQTTALVASVIGKPHVPLYVRGSDGKVHLEYDLISTSVFPTPVTLTKIEVRAGDGRRLLVLRGDDLEAVTHQVLGANPTREVPPSGAVATLVDVEVPPGEVPYHLTNRISYKPAPDTPEILEAIIGSLEITGPKLGVPRSPVTAISPPLSGEGWWDGNGCCAPTPHRSNILAVDGLRRVMAETFAIDWVRIKGNRLFEGDGRANEQYFAFGAKVRSATDGLVVSVRDGLPNERPNEPPAHVRRPEDFSGNNVVVRVRPGVYATYAHLQRGSIGVEVGDHVQPGQRIGRLGNSGNASQPHLHFQLSDGPDILTSNSLPFVIDRYEFVGSVTPDSTDEDIHIVGSPSEQRRTYPLFPSVADFR
jgi:hypothetical protein